MKLHPGIYERLISLQVKQAMAEAERNDLHCHKESIDSAEAPGLLAHYIADRLRSLLSEANLSLQEQFDIANKLLIQMGANEEELLTDAKEILSFVATSQQNTRMKVTQKVPSRPLSGFRTSTLFTGGQSELSLYSEIQREIASADEICIIVSFLRLSGIRLLMDKLREFCQQPHHRLRIITTTYCGITEARALEQLAELPRTEIRISYNTKIERLHAKAYIFLRDSEHSTAYIGSSNLSRAAQTDGLEWNVRVTQAENPEIIKSAKATFERYWESDQFEDYRLGGRRKFEEELQLQRSPAGALELQAYQRYQLLPHQKAILDRLQVERQELGLLRNLLVAATGTGKTVISAFDYKYFREKHPDRHRLLFVAHREEILKQALQTYRSVLGDRNFGELWVGSYRPTQQLDHLFLSVASLKNNLELFRQQGLDFYDFLVIDEAHHAAAESYRPLVTEFRPLILLGLTATPERMDGQSLLPDFGNRVSAEIRLPQALQEGLLTPFQYFGIADSVELDDAELWSGGKYLKGKLSERLQDQERLALIVTTLQRYLPDEHACRALCFCTDIAHARFMAEGLRHYGLKAAVLTSQASEDERKQLRTALAEGKINYLCTVDLFNEGVDIPEVDTILFLRPTESLTIFLQQLGRGLRLSPGKDYLTVLDFVARSNKDYDFSSRFRALCLRGDRKIKEQVEQGFTDLPLGCSIYLERKAQEHILDQIRQATFRQARLISQLRAYSFIPTLGTFLEDTGIDLRQIYRWKGWTALKAHAGKAPFLPDEPRIRGIAERIGNLAHINSVRHIRYIQRLLSSPSDIYSQSDISEEEQRQQQHFKLMLYYNLFVQEPAKLGYESIDQALLLLEHYPTLKEEILELLSYQLQQLQHVTSPLGQGLPSGLELYGRYSREEVFILFDRQTESKSMRGFIGGTFDIPEMNLELIFVTLNKSDKLFSPSTLYDDYFISEHRFHWQSPNKLSHSNAGERYPKQAESGRRFLLFVRESTRDSFQITQPYTCLGLMRYLASAGDFPMNIEWELLSPALPAFLPRG